MYYTFSCSHQSSCKNATFCLHEYYLHNNMSKFPQQKIHNLMQYFVLEYDLINMGVPHILIVKNMRFMY